jgi:hypothetical protein
MLATKCALVALLALWNSKVAFAQDDEDLVDEDLVGLDDEADVEQANVIISAHKVRQTVVLQ